MENLEEKKKKKKIDPDYLTKDASEMRREIEKNAKKSSDDPSAYKKWSADHKDKNKSSPHKTKASRHTKAFEKMFPSKKEGFELELSLLESEDDVVLEDVEFDLEILREFIEEVIQEKKSKSNPTKALKNKAERANAPVGALRAIYNKGLAAWRTGHRPGTSPHQWAMARVNSVLTGGPARRVDATQWDQIRKHRSKKRKKKKD